MDSSIDPRVQIISDAIRAIPNFPKEGILFQDVTTLMLQPAAFKHSVDLLYERYKDQSVDVIAGGRFPRGRASTMRAGQHMALTPLQRCRLHLGVRCACAPAHPLLPSLAAGFEARGLIFGAPLALALQVPFVPLRKPGKLPGETIHADYITEYSTDRIEMHVGAVKPGQRVVLVDDLVATGGTLCTCDCRHKTRIDMIRFGEDWHDVIAPPPAPLHAVAGLELMKTANAEVVECACIIELPDLNGRQRLEGIPLHVLVEKAEHTDS